MYQLCQAGKKEEVRQKIQSMPKAQVDKSQRANSEEQEIGVCCFTFLTKKTYFIHRFYKE